MRMYFFVPYQLKGIQAGIQAGHAALEYVQEYGNTPEYKDFIENHKTWIILNGGTTRSFEDALGRFGSLNEIQMELFEMGVAHSIFREPDLNDALTAVCFLVPRNVYDREMVPDFEDFREGNTENLEGLFNAWVRKIGGKKNVFLRELISGKQLATN
jgi:hypothetical protein